MVGLSPKLRYLHLVRCPGCQGVLDENPDRLVCESCQNEFATRDGVSRLYWPHSSPSPGDVTNHIRSFYESNPFPDYEDFDSLASLIDEAKKSVFARLLDREIPFGARVLECGCGTGQLSNFLGIAHRTVFGVDLSLNSLALAQAFRDRYRLDRVFFLQMNLFSPVFSERSFDVVICNGVLHHTSDPRLGYRTLSRLVKPGGHLIVGLYHRFGRMATDLRRWIFRLSGQRLAFLDPRLRQGNLGEARKRAWFNDQYRNPHEVKYTISRVLDWIEPNGLEFVRSIPQTRLLPTPVSGSQTLFQPDPGGGPVSRWIVELSQILKGGAEGGALRSLPARRNEKEGSALFHQRRPFLCRVCGHSCDSRSLSTLCHTHRR